MNTIGRSDGISTGARLKSWRTGRVGYLLAGFVAGLCVGYLMMAPAMEEGVSSRGVAEDGFDQGEMPQGGASEVAALREQRDALHREAQRLREELEPLRLAEEKKAAALEKRRLEFVSNRLSEYDAILDLTPEQQELIGELEWEAQEYWQAVREKKLQPSRNPWTDVKTEVLEILTPEQREIYEAHLEEKQDHGAEVAATALLGRYPVTLNLTDSQEDLIYRNLYLSFHKDSRLDFNHKMNERRDEFENSMNLRLYLAAEEVLDEEQRDALREVLQASAPQRRN